MTTAEPTEQTRFTADEFQRMCDAGVFGSRRVELISGRIYRMPAQLDPHEWTIGLCVRVFSPLVPVTEMLLVPGTLGIDDDSIVDPDLVWSPAPFGTPRARRPLPVLVIEVSDRTYKKDSGIKLRKYAKLGIADYWIVNLKAMRIEAYRDPTNLIGELKDCSFRHVRYYVAGEVISPLLRPDVSIAVASCLPPASSAGT